jgi:hypothetical protein
MARYFLCLPILRVIESAPHRALTHSLPAFPRKLLARHSSYPPYRLLGVVSTAGTEESGVEDRKATANISLQHERIHSGAYLSIGVTSGYRDGAQRGIWRGD